MSLVISADRCVNCNVHYGFFRKQKILSCLHHLCHVCFAQSRVCPLEDRAGLGRAVSVESSSAAASVQKVAAQALDPSAREEKRREPASLVSYTAVFPERGVVNPSLFSWQQVQPCTRTVSFQNKDWIVPCNYKALVDCPSEIAHLALRDLPVGSFMLSKTKRQLEHASKRMFRISFVDQRQSVRDHYLLLDPEQKTMTLYRLEGERLVFDRTGITGIDCVHVTHTAFGETQEDTVKKTQKNMRDYMNGAFFGVQAHAWRQPRPASVPFDEVMKSLGYQ